MWLVSWLAAGAQAADVLSLTLAWSASPDQAGAWFGHSVSSAGDVNGDGFDDVLVGAPQGDDGMSLEGQAYLYYGSASGPEATPAWVADADQELAAYGTAVAAAGDVNNDGYDDVIVGAPDQDGLALEDEGMAYLFVGSQTGLGTLPIWSFGSGQAGARFGSSVASAGDVNSDGYDDVIVGAELYDGGDVAEGRIYVFHGRAAGLQDTPDWTVEIDKPDSLYGFAVSAAGDINADSYDDVIVGAVSETRGDEADEGVVYVYLGSPNGLSEDYAWDKDADQESAGLGTSVAAAGDVNGDGFGDVIVGAPNYDDPESDEGKVFVYHGSQWGLNGEAAWTAESGQDGGLHGHDVAGAGDVNDDGYADVIVSAASYDGGEVDEGRVFVYLGSEKGLSDTPTTLEVDQAGARFGTSVAFAGDVNGDDYDDILVGSSLYDDGEDDEGRAFLFGGTFAGSLDADADGSPRPLDCDDADATVYPGAIEVCDGKDNGCTGAIPDEDADLDGDGTARCADDCDDDNAGIHPGADEVCDGHDTNCDGVFDPDDVDVDGDAWAACFGDCDDGDPSLSPGAPEVCDDAIDNNCDGTVDEDCDAGGCSCGGGATGGWVSVLIALAAMARRRSYRSSAA